ncbi:unnamed protein product [Litomosoides sigmodontis]|uniref:Uncharacterized protein n=1 Tax=Litomosoides sigmodontis TaxID=42156 RepID=A0A3P6SPG4_LITSI|nr:unnamed protein product [Litomosoides sigmodontis]
MDNETIVAYKGKIAITEASIASIAAVISDNWSELPLDDAIIKFLDNSTAASSGSDTFDVIPTAATSTNSTFQNFFNTINKGWSIFEESPRLIWILVGAGTLIIVVLITVVVYLFMSKKNCNKKSTESRENNQRITDSYDNISHFAWFKWMLCCPKSIFDRQENHRMMRVNSASNLGPYRRPPLQPAHRQGACDDQFRNDFLLSHRLESSNRGESCLGGSDGKAEQTSVLATGQTGSAGNLYAINITGIQGVPVMPMQNDRRRPLPVPPPSCFNHL